jgi:hypothetical protein
VAINETPFAGRAANNPTRNKETRAMESIFEGLFETFYVILNMLLATIFGGFNELLGNFGIDFELPVPEL